MNRQHIWKTAPFVLVLTSLAWWAHAQSVSGTAEAPVATRSTTSAAPDEPEALGAGSAMMMVSTQRAQRSTRGRSQDPERMLENQTRTLVDEYRASSDTGKRAATKDNLTAVVKEHFVLRQTMRQSELDELEKELNRLKALHERRQNQQDKIVADRVESLLREADGLGWGSSSARSGVPRGFPINSPSGIPPSYSKPPTSR